MNLISRIVVLFMSLALTALPGVGASASEIYVWTDEDGVTHYSSLPPPEDAGAETITLSDTPGVSPENSPDSQERGLDASESTEASPPEATGEDDLWPPADERLAQMCDLAWERLQELETSLQPDENGERAEMEPMIESKMIREVSKLRRYTEINCK